MSYLRSQTLTALVFPALLLSACCRQSLQTPQVLLRLAAENPDERKKNELEDEIANQGKSVRAYLMSELTNSNHEIRMAALDVLLSQPEKLQGLDLVKYLLSATTKDDEASIVLTAEIKLEKEKARAAFIAFEGSPKKTHYSTTVFCGEDPAGVAEAIAKGTISTDATNFIKKTLLHDATRGDRAYCSPSGRAMVLAAIDKVRTS